jgi:hypothetical protein
MVEFVRSHVLEDWRTAQAVIAKRFDTEPFKLNDVRLRVPNFHPYFRGGEATAKSGMLLQIEGTSLTNKNIPFVQRQSLKLTIIEH